MDDIPVSQFDGHAADDICKSPKLLFSQSAGFQYDLLLFLRIERKCGLPGAPIIARVGHIVGHDRNTVFPSRVLRVDLGKSVK